MPFINYLKYLRIRKGLKRPQLAALIDRKVISVRKYEEGNMRVSPSMAQTLALILDGQEENLTGFIKRIHLHPTEYADISKSLPRVKISSKPTKLADILNLNKRKISLKDCHALVLTSKKA